MHTARQQPKRQELNLASTELSDVARAEIAKVQDGTLILKVGKTYNPEMIKYFQGLLGVEQTGVYDQTTKIGVRNYQKQNRVIKEDGSEVQLRDDSDLGPRTFRSLVQKDPSKFAAQTGLTVLGEEAFRSAINDDWLGGTVTARASFPRRENFDFNRDLRGNLITERLSPNGVSIRFQYQMDERRVNPNLLEELSLAASSLGITDLYISSAITGHRKKTTTGNVSNHVGGNAVDIAAINGIPCDTSHPEGKQLADKLVQLLEARGFARDRERGNERAVLWGFNDPRKGGNHTDHIHLSLRTRSLS